MGYGRLLAELPSAEVAAERARTTRMLMCVVDDLIARVNVATHPVAEHLLAAFGAEIARLRRAVREGWTAEEFERSRAGRDRGSDRDRTEAERGTDAGG